MLTESEIKAYTVDIPNDIQAAQRASGSMQRMVSEQTREWLGHRETFRWICAPCHCAWNGSDDHCYRCGQPASHENRKAR